MALKDRPERLLSSSARMVRPQALPRLVPGLLWHADEYVHMHCLRPRCPHGSKIEAVAVNGVMDGAVGRFRHVATVQVEAYSHFEHAAL